MINLRDLAKREWIGTKLQKSVKENLPPQNISNSLSVLEKQKGKPAHTFYLGLQQPQRNGHGQTSQGTYEMASRYLAHKPLKSWPRKAEMEADGNSRVTSVLKLKCSFELPVVADGASTKSMPLKLSGFRIVQEMEFFIQEWFLFLMNPVKILATLRI